MKTATFATFATLLVLYAICSLSIALHRVRDAYGDVYQYDSDVSNQSILQMGYVSLLAPNGKRAKIIRHDEEEQSFTKPIVRSYSDQNLFSDQEYEAKVRSGPEIFHYKLEKNHESDINKRSYNESPTYNPGQSAMDYANIKFWKKMSELSVQQFLEKVSVKTLAKSRYSIVRSYQTAYSGMRLKPEFRTKKPNNSDSDIFLKIPKIHDAKLVFSEHAGCKPRLECVEVDDALIHNRVKKHGIMYYPKCVEIERCSGCCLHQCLVCRPKTVTPKKFVLMEIDVIFNEVGPVLTYSGSVSVTLHKHDSCECQCNTDIEYCLTTYCSESNNSKIDL